MPKFEIGDFVLLAAPEKKFPPKLQAKWTGPYTAIETISSHVYRVEHLVHWAKEMAHISKLRFYSDAGLGITEEIKDQIAFDENQEQLVSKILQVRKKKSIWEFQVAWEDFDKPTWKDSKRLYSDVPDSNVRRKKPLAFLDFQE